VTINYKPTDGEICRYLQDKQALVLLDDIELPRPEVESILDAAPACTFVLASPERHLWGGECTLSLGGLPEADALTLLERELGRPLTPAEQPTAQTICTALNGHPLSLRQSAAMVRDQGLTLAEVAQRIASPEETEEQALAVLPQPERRVLAALASVGGAFVHPDHINQIMGSGDANSMLESLLQRGLVRAEGPRFGLSETLLDTIHQTWDLTAATQSAMAHFTTWAEALRDAPERLLEEADAILQLLAWGVDTGRWADVIRLGQAVDGALALGRQWGAWAQVLQWVLQAARSLGDQTAQAWALHQSGTRALCLGEKRLARDALVKALRLREALGDQMGAAVTRHNLQFLFPPVPPKDTSEPAAPGAPAAPIATVLTKAVIGFLVVALIVWGSARIINALRPPPSTPQPVVPPTFTLTLTPIPTNSPISTMTSPPMSTPTFTPTPTSVFTPTPCPCGVPPANWVLYTVQPKDSIYSLAREHLVGAAASLSQLVNQIAYYNCLCPNTSLEIGQQLYLPSLPTPTPTSILTPTLTHTSTPTFTPTSIYTPTSTLTYTPSPTPDLVPPPVPIPLEPGTFDSSAPTTYSSCYPLRWSAVGDPSGVMYEVAIQRRVSASWVFEASWYPLQDFQQNFDGCDEATSYRWHVRAYDGQGNLSGWSRWMYFRYYTAR
jgi:hypothetical protein